MTKSDHAFVKGEVVTVLGYFCEADGCPGHPLPEGIPEIFPRCTGVSEETKRFVEKVNEAYDKTKKIRTQF